MAQEDYDGEGTDFSAFPGQRRRDVDKERYRKRDVDFPSFPGHSRDWEKWEPINIGKGELKTVLKPILHDFALELDRVEKIRDGEWIAYSINRLGREVLSLVWTKHMPAVEKEDLEDFYEEMLDTDANNAIFITTSHFTEKAQEFAEPLPLKLVDAIELGERLPEEKTPEVEKVFLTDKSDEEVVDHFETRRKKKTLRLFGEEEQIDYIDRRYSPYGVYKLKEEEDRPGEESSKKLLVNLNNGLIPYLEERKLEYEDIVQIVMELPEGARETLLDLITYGKLDFENVKGRDLNILEKERLITVSGKETNKEKSFVDIILEDINDTATVLSRSVGGAADPHEQEMDYKQFHHPSKSRTIRESSKARANIHVPQINRAYDLEHFIHSQDEPDEKFDLDEIIYGPQEIRRVLERIYKTEVEFKGYIYMPYFIAKYESEYKTRYLTYQSPAFNEKVIPEKTHEYGIYHFIDKYPELPYLLMGIVYLHLAFVNNRVPEVLHIFASSFLFLVLTLLVGITLKAIFRTPRKVPRYGESVARYGFPSIHSMISVGSVSFIYFVNPMLTIPLALLALLYIYSRLQIGVHNEMDVIGGAIIGFLIGVFSGIYIYQQLHLPEWADFILTVLFFVVPVVISRIETASRKKRPRRIRP